MFKYMVNYIIYKISNNCNKRTGLVNIKIVDDPRTAVITGFVILTIY